MGVHGLWDLLAPVGRRVSVETLAGKKLAIDASIWMVQFMKAMRDEKGEMVRNAHLLGFFRRICKLLYLRTKPVFVFDGATPALKRRTVIARRKQRENAQAKIRKTAEKLLLNHLKAMRLKELAKDLENQRKNQKNNAKGKKIVSDQTDVEARNPENNDVVSERYDLEKLDEMLAESVAAEEYGSLNNIASTSAAVAPDGEEEDGDEDEEMILPVMDGNVDPAMLAALPPSVQLDLLMRDRLMAENRKNNQEGKQDIGNQNERHKNSSKGKEILSDQTEMEGSNVGRDDGVAQSYNQEKLDEMLAASLAAEEDGNLIKKALTSATTIISEDEGGDEDEDEDEEMVLPAMHGKIDPAVLAALPPSMQLDLLVQMRERLMAENRQRYQRVKKAPEKFSELQIEAYLKTVAFRREIDQVQKAAAGKGVGGVQTSRIASEANREFIFSSSFTGDKQSLTSSGVQRNGDKQQQTPIGQPSSDSLDSAASIVQSNTVTGLALAEPRRASDDNVETYLDERGRIRVSRVRAMGMRMTRDLQRNLDLIKEIEQDRTSAQSVLNRNKTDSPNNFSSQNQHVRRSLDKNGDSVILDEQNAQSMLNNETSLQISFNVDSESKCFDSDDDIFASLAAGQPIKISSTDNNTSRRQSSVSASDSDWEEGIIEGKDNSTANDVELGTKPSLEVSNVCDDSEVEWEEGICDVRENSSFPAELGKTVSRGYLEEEADLQEAIRRSLEDAGSEKVNHVPSEMEILKSLRENVCEGVGFIDCEDDICGENMLGNNAAQQNESFSEILDVEKQNGAEAVSSARRQLQSSDAHDPDNQVMLISKSCENYLHSKSGQSGQDMNRGGNLSREMPSAASVAPLEAKESHLIVEDSSSTFAEDSGPSTSAKMHLQDGSHISKVVCGNYPDAMLVDVEKNYIEPEPSVLVNEQKVGSEAEPSCHSADTANAYVSPVEPFTKDSTNAIGVGPKLAGEKNPDAQSTEREHYRDQSVLMDHENVQVDFAEASLDEEMRILGQERLNLGDVQRKLERNAESVSSEMFAECQELLQMFGLPYIIAPMEAEAQCAYMELADLVDGVVTDDSDVLLFGAQSVFKNIFDDRKYVETYFMKDIEKELGLTREKLIRMALLLGSDYTEGVSGIGIVNAIEVVNAFPEEDGLHKFREWVESPDPSILGKFDMQKIGSKVGANDLNCANSNIEGSTPLDQNIPQAQEQKQSADHTEEIKQIFMDKHRNVSKNWHIPSSFPSEAVISAYSCPQVDKSTEPFTWAKPDLHVLHRLCWEKFAWGSQKTDELLLPVLKEYDKRETQLRLEAFYTFNERFAKIRSKRINKAVKGITRNQSSDLMDDAVEEVSKNRKKRSSGKSRDNVSDKPSKRTEESVLSNVRNPSEKSAPKRPRKKKTAGEPVLFEVENPEQQWQAEERRHTNRGSHRNRRGKGRGRGRGMGRGRVKGSLGLELSDSSSGDVNGGDDEDKVHSEKSERLQEVRRSTRSRKPACYTENDLEIDSVDKSLDQGDGERLDDEAVEQSLFGAQGISRDASTGLNGKDQHEVADPSIDDFSGAYLERGVGFCTNEGEVGLPGVSQNHYPFEADGSEDHLKMGGGFCVEESDTGKDQDVPHGSTMAAGLESAASSYSSCLLEKADHGSGSVQSIARMKRILNESQDGGKTNASDIKPNMDCVNETCVGDHSKDGSSPPQSSETNAGISCLQGLSAMPFLKRKRRKS